jgi:hypothetical protein
MYFHIKLLLNKRKKYSGEFRNSKFRLINAWCEDVVLTIENKYCYKKNRMRRRRRSEFVTLGIKYLKSIIKYFFILMQK